MQQKIRGEYVTIRSLLVQIKKSREYENILRISRSESKIENPSDKTIRFAKDAEVACTIKIRDAVMPILKRRINRSRNEDAEIEKFLKSLQKWVEIILPAYEFSMEYWRQEFQDRFYLRQARKD